MNEKVPPQNLDAEKSVLGAILLDPDGLINVLEFLTEDHFYSSRHATIFKSMIQLFDERLPIDLVTLPDRLAKNKELDRCGGVEYLADLVSFTPSSVNLETYGRLVKETAVKRKLIATATKIAEMGYDGNIEVDELLDEAEQTLYSVSQENLKEDFVPLRNILEKSFDRLDELHRNKGEMRGVPTGLAKLDHMLSGLQESNLIILAARPSVGKSSLATNIAQYAAIEKKVPIGIFSLEMSANQLSDRMLSSQADVDSWKISTGNLNDGDFDKITLAMGELAEAPIFIDDTPGINIMELRAKARRLHAEHKVGMIIVDYLQLVQGKRNENRVQEVSDISQALKNIARELSIPVLALAQLSRAVESRGETRPKLSDLRESGSIEQDADVVMFLYRPSDENRESVHLSIAKHRNGPTGEIPLYFRGGRTKFYEMETTKVEAEE